MTQYQKHREREEMRLQTTTKQKEDHVPYNPNNPPLSKTTKELLPILHSSDRTKKAVPIPPIITYKRPSAFLYSLYVVQVICKINFCPNYLALCYIQCTYMYMYIQIKNIHIIYVHTMLYYIYMSVPSTEKKNSRVVPDSRQIYEKNVINMQMYVMNDYATHTYTICNLKQ